jgi:hypothetical protein
VVTPLRVGTGLAFITMPKRSVTALGSAQGAEPRTESAVTSFEKKRKIGPAANAAGLFISAIPLLTCFNAGLISLSQFARMVAAIQLF